MSLLKKHLNPNSEAVKFNPADFGQEIKKECPEIIFSIILGSSASGCVAPFSDIDLALYLTKNRKPDLKLYSQIYDICEKHAPGIRCDIGILNGCEPVYRFEALKGNLLFTRDMETWLSFYSLTCREYELQMFHYEKQRLYRLEYNSRPPSI